MVLNLSHTQGTKRIVTLSQSQVNKQKLKYEFTKSSKAVLPYSTEYSN
jgi:hypothetical protein